MFAKILSPISLIFISHKRHSSLLNSNRFQSSHNLRMVGIKVRFWKINIEIMLRKMNILFVEENWVSIIVTCHAICIRIHPDLILYNMLYQYFILSFIIQKLGQFGYCRVSLWRFLFWRSPCARLEVLQCYLCRHFLKLYNDSSSIILLIAS